MNEVELIALSFTGGFVGGFMFGVILSAKKIEEVKDEKLDQENLVMKNGKAEIEN